MGLWSWLKGLRAREDEDALRRAEDERRESPAERQVTRGDVEGVQSDELAGLTWGETPEQAGRLAERDDE